MKAKIIESKARAGDAEVDSIIKAWAQSGVFDEAATEAIAKSHAKGNAVTIIEDQIVYKLMPDGSKIEVRKLASRTQRVFSSGTIYIR